MYDEEVQYYDPPRRGPLIALSIFVSALTSAGVFFGLRALEQRGVIGARQPSGGTEAVEVPALVNMPVDQARQVLQGRDLLLVLEAEREDPRVPAGSLLAQTPLPGSHARRGATVQAVVSKGPPAAPPPAASAPPPPAAGAPPPSPAAAVPPPASEIAVPKVTGLRLQKAKKTLEDAGLKVGVTKYRYDEDRGPYVILKQDPAPGANAAAGTAVDLVVNEP